MPHTVPLTHHDAMIRLYDDRIETLGHTIQSKDETMGHMQGHIDALNDIIAQLRGRIEALEGSIEAMDAHLKLLTGEGEPDGP